MRSVLAAALAAIVALALASCEASGSMTVPPGVPYVGGSTVSVTFKIDEDAGTIELPEQPDGLPAGTCVKVIFLDGAGNPIGSSELEVGSDPAPAPDGTKGIGLAACDPPEPTDTKKDKARRHSLSQLVASSLTFGYRLLPYDVRDGHMQYCDYLVTATGRNRADAVSAAFRRDLTSAPPPAGLTTYGFSESLALPDGDVAMTLVTQEPPRALRFDVDGQRVVELTSPGVTVALEGGWWKTRFTLPSALVAFPGTTDVEYTVELDSRDVGASIALTTGL
jgi:hypothetical protein